MNRLLRKVVSPLITAIYLFTVLLNGIPFSYAQEEKVYYFLNDHLGNVDVVLDEEGNVVERRDYLPYGDERVIVEEPDAPDTDYGFTGKEKDDETGLHYYGARYYDATTGRFISPDPLLFRVDQMSEEERNQFLSDPQNLNAYTYAKNNPIKYVDPDGEVAVLAALIVATAFVATFMSSYQNVAAPDINSPPVYTKSNVEIGGELAKGAVVAAVSLGAPKAVQFGFRTVSQLKSYRKMVAEGIDPKVAADRVTSDLTEAQRSNLERFNGKFRKDLAETEIHNLPSGGKAYQKDVPATNIPGSKAVYEKQVSPEGQTINYTKTTYDSSGNIVHVKDKLNVK